MVVYRYQFVDYFSWIMCSVLMRNILVIKYKYDMASSLFQNVSVVLND